MQAYEKFLMRRWDKKMAKFNKEEEDRRVVCKRDRRVSTKRAVEKGRGGETDSLTTNSN